MPADKYPCIFSCQMVPIVYIESRVISLVRQIDKGRRTATQSIFQQDQQQAKMESGSTSCN